MYEREKAEMSTALAQAFPGCEFQVSASAGEGWSSATVKWTGGPSRADVRAVMGPWQPRFGPITLDYTDPRLLQAFEHLRPKSNDRRESSHDAGVLNVRRHLQHLYPNTRFEITDSLGPMTNHTSVTVKWDTALEGAPTLQDVKAVLEIFKSGSGSPGPTPQNQQDFRRIFGGFNYVDLESKPIPAPTPPPAPAPVEASPPPAPRRWWRR